MIHWGIVGHVKLRGFFKLTRTRSFPRRRSDQVVADDHCKLLASGLSAEAVADDYRGGAMAAIHPLPWHPPGEPAM